MFAHVDLAQPWAEIAPMIVMLSLFHSHPWENLHFIEQASILLLCFIIGPLASLHAQEREELGNEVRDACWCFLQDEKDPDETEGF